MSESAGPSPRTLGAIAADVVRLLDDGQQDAALDILDGEFLEDWIRLMEEPTPLRPGEKRKLLKNLRGMVVAVHTLTRMGA